MQKILQFFDKLEDKVRAQLSRAPLWYAFFGGIGIVLFWRGIWEMADSLHLAPGYSAIIGTVILLTTGVFVSAFIGNRLILSGLTGEKKLAEKAKGEIETEEDQIKKIQKTVDEIKSEVKLIRK